jgi:hypothetical protein
MMTDEELIARLRLYGSKFHHEFGHNAAADRIEALEAKLAKAVEALGVLIQLAHDCEKELTEDLYHVDFCGESMPLTNARATLAEIKGESHERHAL